VRCVTDPIGHATPHGRSVLDIVVDASGGFIPLWDKDTTLRWRFKPKTLRYFKDPHAAGKQIRKLIGEALVHWSPALPVKFKEDNDTWDFQVTIRKGNDCDASGCVLASSFFPDSGRHDLLLYPKMFEEDAQEQLDTVIHELYHIDPEQKGIRRIEREDGTCCAHSHGPQFLANVAEMVSEYLDTSPQASTYEFLKHDFDTLEALHGGVTGTSFRPFPSYPQRFQERLADQPPCSAELVAVDVEPWREPAPRALFTEDDLHVRQFLRATSRKVAIEKRQERAA